ncbi:MAG: hypothetical protein ABSB36_07850 [Candidatus Dormibacteria bacterium]|jgi:hypothetical protein
MLGAESMQQRFNNLYDRDRWRRYGYSLTAVGTLCVVLAAIFESRKDEAAGQVWLISAALTLGLAISLWMRQRYSYARFDGGQLVFRYLTVTVRIDLVEIRRSRIVKLAAAVQGRVRTPKSLAGADALVLQLRHPDTARLRRMLTRRCVFEEELVIPLAGAAVLHRQIEAALSPQRRAEGSESRPDPNRSRRRNRRR